MYLGAGAYIAIMLAVLGAPQMPYGYFDIRERRRERAETRAENERVREETRADSERRHREMMAAALAHNAGREQSEAISNLQQVMADLRAEVAGLRRERANGNHGPPAE